MTPLRYTDGREWRKGIPQEEPGEERAPRRLRRFVLDDGASERFWTKVEVRDRDGCWLWCGARDSRGYGRFWTGGWQPMAHRVAWALHHKTCPGDSVVLHTCDNPRCVNPAHLEIGTQRQNLKDMARKGRANLPNTKGERNANARLSPELVCAMRWLFVATNLGPTAIGRAFGVTRQTAIAIRDRVAWRHI